MRIVHLGALVSLAFAAGCGSSSTTPGGSATPGDDLKALQGKWNLVEFVRDGRAREVKDTALQFEGDVMSDVVPKGGSERFRIKLDPSKSPKEIDFAELSKDGTVKKFPTDKDGEVDAVFKGIYELRGDTLQISVAMHSPVNPRPTSLDADDGKVHRLKLERIK